MLSSATSPNEFYRRYYHGFLIGLIGLIILIIIVLGVVMYQILKRPLPVFYALSDGKQMQLFPSTEPNLLPQTVIRWSMQAAIAAYNFDFSNYNAEVAEARPYFTDNGWADYTRSLNSVIKNVTQNQLNVTGVVDSPAVISNQGSLPDKGYSWRVQIPFLVSYVSAGLQGNLVTQNRYYIILTLVRVPTYLNPQGIGIDQFVMVNR